MKLLLVVNMFSFLYDRLAKRMNRYLAQSFMNKDGLVKTGYKIKGINYYQLINNNNSSYLTQTAMKKMAIKNQE